MKCYVYKWKMIKWMPRFSVKYLFVACVVACAVAYKRTNV